MATLNDVISCYNELVDEVNGHTASIDALTANLQDVSAVSTAMASLTAKLAQVEARLDELVQEHDVMMDTISSLLAAPTPTVEETSTVELKRVSKEKTVPEETPTTVEEEQPAPALKRVEKKRAPEPTVVEEQPTATVVAPTPAPTPAPAPKTKTAVTEIQKRALARQYMVEHGAKVEDLRNPDRINETIASEEFTAWMNAR